MAYLFRIKKLRKSGSLPLYWLKLKTYDECSLLEYDTLGLVEVYRRFGGTFCFHLHGLRVVQAKQSDSREIILNDYKNIRIKLGKIWMRNQMVVLSSLFLDPKQ
jgi:hypothetical protein